MSASGSNGMVAAGHPLTAQAGADVLRAGGNAVDAAVGACLASWAVEPLLTGPGAGGYMLVAGAGVEPVLLDFFVAAPSGGDPADLEPVTVSFGDAQQLFYVGAASCGVPGTPAGLDAALERWGSVDRAMLAAPAAALARGGSEVNAPQAYIYELLAPILAMTPQARERFAPGGGPLREGDVFRCEALGATIERFGAEGAEPFYRGDIAADTCAWVAEHGGTLLEADLAGYQAIARAPARVTYRGREVLTNPPPSAGGILLALAMARLDRLSTGRPSAAALAEAMEDAQSARTEDFDRGLGDPGFMERFLALRLGSTTHISAVDGAGLACSVTCTNGEGSGLVVPRTGIHVNNIMGEEDLSPLGFFACEPGRRMPSMMAPTAVLCPSGAVELVLGSAGSNRIRSAILQTVVNVVDCGMDARTAVDAPRMHFEDGVVFAEPGVDVDALRQAGREVVPFRGRNIFFGGVQAIERDPDSGRLTGAADPRRGGAAVAA